MAALVWALGCGPQSPAYINPAVTDAYDEANRSYRMDPPAAERALRRADELVKDNAYNHVLWAAFHAHQGNLDVALEHLERALNSARNIHFVREEPPQAEMNTLTMTRAIADVAEPLRAWDRAQAERYLETGRQVGLKMAETEPQTSLGVVAAIALVRRMDSLAREYFEAVEDEAALARVQARAERFEAWAEDFREALREELDDVILEAGRRAGLNDEELRRMAAGYELEDKAKQRKVEEAFGNMYEAEKKALATLVGKMPRD